MTAISEPTQSNLQRFFCFLADDAERAKNVQKAKRQEVNFYRTPMWNVPTAGVWTGLSIVGSLFERKRI